MAKLHFVMGEIGGVGKSVFCKVLVETYQSLGSEYHLVDADRTTPNVGLSYSPEIYTPTIGRTDNAKRGQNLVDRDLVYFSEDLDDFSIPDRLLDLASERDVIVNMPAQVSNIVNKWIDACDLLGKVKTELGIETIGWFVARPSSGSLKLLKADYEYHQGKMQYVLVKNQLRGTGSKWEDLLDQDLLEFLASANIPSIELPELILAPQERDLFDREYPTYSALIAPADKRLGIASKMRMKKFLAEAIAQIESTHSLGENECDTVPIGSLIPDPQPAVVETELVITANAESGVMIEVVDMEETIAEPQSLNSIEESAISELSSPNIAVAETKPSAKRGRGKKSTEAPAPELAGTQV